MISYKYVLILTLPCATMHAMHNALINGAHAGLPHGNASFAQPQCPILIASRHNAVAVRKTAGALQEGSMSEGQCTAQSKETMPWQPAMQSVELGDAQAVKDHFSAWKYMILPWHYYHQGIADALQHAAEFPAEKTGTIVEFLLTKIDFDNVQDISILERNARKNGHELILKSICAKMHKEKQCCLEDTPKVADITQDQKQEPQSALHIAAANKDYNACVEQLIAWSGPLQEDEVWPAQATYTFEECGKRGVPSNNLTPECESALQRISAFTVSENKLIQERVRLMQEQKRAINSQGQTAYDVAQAAGANKKLLSLLDPNNVNHDVLRSFLWKDLDRRSGVPQYSGKPPAMVQFPKGNKKPVDPNGPIFQVGEEVVIDGVVYKVTTIKKVK